MERSRILAFALLGYIIVVGVGIETINMAWGNLLPKWYQYPWGGERMRGEMGEFQSILLLFGAWVYPFSVVAVYLFVRQAIVAKSRGTWFLFVASAVTCLAVLGRFLWLGVFKAGMGALN
ncbi:hypothetical protein IAD21_03913 [Abditibacteriota bacterium]|nr:hypothetical protein IAD21_03913 [Abditibacteriota bacterium]